MPKIWRRTSERYAKADEHANGFRVHGTPFDWHMLRVIEEETGKLVDDVIEINCDEGWLRRHVRTEDGCGYELEGVNGGRTLKTERVEGKFRLEREVEM